MNILNNHSLLKEMYEGKPKNQLDGKKAAILKRLAGIKDSRSKVGIASRGRNVYKGGSLAAHRGGGPQYGRPTVKRRLNGKS